MKIINLTGQPVTIFRSDNDKEPLRVPSANCLATSKMREEFFNYQDEGIPVNRISYGKVLGLPAPEAGTVYIVTETVARALAMKRSKRKDVYTTGRAIRNKIGRAVGYYGLRQF